jgi:hypothetical protein
VRFLLAQPAQASDERSICLQLVCVQELGFDKVKYLPGTVEHQRPQHGIAEADFASVIVADFEASDVAPAESVQNCRR